MIEYLKRLGFYPRNVVWELTLACNLRCRHCGSRAGKARDDELTEVESLDVVDQLAALGAERVVDVIVDSIAPLLAMTIVPFVLCFWWDKANKYGALAGIFGGLTGWGTAALVGTQVPPDLIGFGVSLVSMVAVALATQRINPPRPLSDLNGDPVELANRFATLRSSPS